MGYASSIGKYQLGRTIGEGTFAKVKLAINTDNGQYVAIKIIDKQMVIKNNLMYQVKREIRTMKLLHHPTIVRIHEVIGTKTKIYIVMDYVSGGQLSDKMSYVKRLNDSEARKYFQQLIDALDYCHCRGVYHRDLKVRMKLFPQLCFEIHIEFDLDIGISSTARKLAFGCQRKSESIRFRTQRVSKGSTYLSTFCYPGDLLSTACGSPSYVAPEVITNKAYEGAAADVWSCGVILFELLAGYLPFDDRSLVHLYRKISRAEYTFTEWFTESQKKLITRILDPNPRTRITIPEIIEDQWFQTNYEPVVCIECDENINLDDVHAAFSSIKENETQTKVPHTPSFINAFQLIAMSRDLDLSRIFEEQDSEKQKITLGSKHTIKETIEKIEAAAKDVSLSVEKMNNSKVKIHPERKMTRCSRSFFTLSAKVVEVAPTHCVVEISKSTGELRLYREFCKSLTNMLTEESGVSTETQAPKEVIVTSNNIHDSELQS